MYCLTGPVMSETHRIHCELNDTCVHSLLEVVPVDRMDNIKTLTCLFKTLIFEFSSPNAYLKMHRCYQ